MARNAGKSSSTAILLLRAGTCSAPACPTMGGRVSQYRGSKAPFPNTARLLCNELKLATRVLPNRFGYAGKTWRNVYRRLESPKPAAGAAAGAEVEPVPAAAAGAVDAQQQ